MSIEELITDAVRSALREELAPIRAAIEALRRHQQPAFVSPARAAELTATSLATIRRRVRDGSVRSKKLGSRVLIDVDSLRPVDETEVAQLAVKVAG